MRMPNRILHESVCTSDSISRLSEHEEVLFYRLTLHCDDYGRTDGRVSVLRAKCFPLALERWPESRVRTALVKLEAVGLIFRYEVDAKEYLQVTNWAKYQRVRQAREKFPPPPAATRGNSPQLAANGADPPPESESESESESNPNPRERGVLAVAHNGNHRRAQRGSTLPEPFDLTEKRKGFAAAGGIVDVELVFGHFKDHHRARGSIMRDWEAAWRTWCRREREMREERQQRRVILR